MGTVSSNASYIFLIAFADSAQSGEFIFELVRDSADNKLLLSNSMTDSLRCGGSSSELWGLLLTFVYRAGN